MLINAFDALRFVQSDNVASGKQVFPCGGTDHGRSRQFDTLAKRLGTSSHRDPIKSMIAIGSGAVAARVMTGKSEAARRGYFGLELLDANGYTVDFCVDDYCIRCFATENRRDWLLGRFQIYLQDFDKDCLRCAHC